MAADGETIIIRGGSVEVEFGPSLAPQDSRARAVHASLESPDNTIYRDEGKKIRRVLVKDNKNDVKLDHKEDGSSGLLYEITVEYS